MYDVVVKFCAAEIFNVSVNIGLVDICKRYVFAPTVGNAAALQENVKVFVLTTLLILFAGAVNVGHEGLILLAKILNPVVGVAPLAEWYTLTKYVVPIVVEMSNVSTPAAPVLLTQPALVKLPHVPVKYCITAL